MANPERGEYDFEIGGRTYTLKLGINALKEIEAKLSKPGERVKFSDAITGALSGDVTYMTAVVWAALRRHHPEIGIADVERLSDEYNGYLPFVKALTPVLTFLLDQTQPDPRDRGEVQGARDRPPAAAASEEPVSGIGLRSTSRRAKSA